MAVKCSDITNYIESFAPTHLAEDWDNVGLILGSFRQEVTRIMVCLDVTSNVVDEAVANKVDLIVSHHPFIFKAMKRINEDDFKGNLIYKLIRSNISVYSAHTNLDVADNGVNEFLAKTLELTNIKNLREYRSEKLYKIVVFVPLENVDAVRDAMSREGAGWIGNYSDCSFMTKGIGTFRPLEGTNPYIGSLGNLEKVDEYRIETIAPQGRLKKVVEAMIKAHPYEEVAYDIYPLEIKGKEYGFGKVGLLEKPLSLEEFVVYVKNKLNISGLRVIGSIDRNIQKVATFCGSFDNNWSGVIKEGADVLVTGDIKYHEALDIVEKGLCVVDAGHFNTEKVIIPALAKMLQEKFPDIEVIRNNMESDPFNFS